MKFNKIIIDSSNSTTDLCRLGAKYPTDKSAYAIHDGNGGHRHGYMAIYDILFAPLRYKKIRLAEGGVFENNSMKCWREYFPYADLYGFEFDSNLLEKAKNDNLENTIYSFIDVNNFSSMVECFDNSGGNFDIIIDDMIHEVHHNAEFAKVAYKYLKSGGLLIVEDLSQIQNNKYGNNFEELYVDYFKDLIPYFSSITLIESKHDNMFSGDCDNNRLLVLFRNEKI